MPIIKPRGKCEFHVENSPSSTRFVFHRFFSCRLAGKLWSSILLLSFSFLFLFLFLSLDNVYPLASYVCEWHNFCDQSYMFDLVQTFSNLFQCNQTCLKLFKHFKTCSNLFKTALFCSNLFKYAQTCSNFIQPLQTCPNT